MTYAEFQEHWEKTSIKERAKYDAMPLDALLSDIKKGQFGTNYQIWYSVGRRATIEQVGWLFFSILESDTDFLNRIHCATALLSIYNPYPDVLKPEKLTGREKYYVDKHLQEYKECLEQKIGKQ